MNKSNLGRTCRHLRSKNMPFEISSGILFHLFFGITKNQEKCLFFNTCFMVWDHQKNIDFPIAFSLFLNVFSKPLPGTICRGSQGRFFINKEMFVGAMVFKRRPLAIQGGMGGSLPEPSLGLMEQVKGLWSLRPFSYRTSGGHTSTTMLQGS